MRSAAGVWDTARQIPDNHQRLVRLDLDVEATVARLVLNETWGNPQAHLFAFDVR